MYVSDQMSGIRRMLAWHSRVCWLVTVAASIAATLLAFSYFTVDALAFKTTTAVWFAVCISLAVGATIVRTSPIMFVIRTVKRIGRCPKCDCGIRDCPSEHCPECGTWIGSGQRDLEEP